MSAADLPEGYDISADPTRLNLDVIHGFISQSYWAKGMPKALVEKMVRHSLGFGVYHHAEQVGFARVVTDKTTFAYLADVFVPIFKACAAGCSSPPTPRVSTSDSDSRPLLIRNGTWRFTGPACTKACNRHVLRSSTQHRSSCFWPLIALNSRDASGHQGFGHLADG
jgi:hypothetical protein